MEEMVLHERITGAKDWATVLFIICFALVAINRNVFSARFAEFSKLAWSNKYTKIYKDSANLQSGFTVSLFLVQVISFAFLLQQVLSHFKMVEKTSWVTFIQLFTLLMVFILGKYLVEKIIATSFNIEEFGEMFNLQKVNYRAYIGVVLLPLNILLYYNDSINAIVLYLILGIIILATVASYALSLRNYQNLILGKIFYFILYLCALEIAPYYFMYYWFTRT